MKNNNTFHTFNDDALADHDGIALSKLLKSKALSPKEVIEASIARAQLIEPRINAIAVDCFESAIEGAKTLNRGFFAGVPTFIKDNTPVQSLPTQHGTNAILAKPEKQHGSYTQQYLSLGFSVLGKSTLPEFGFNATTEPAHTKPTRNPWNTDYSTGASSGGSAALVAAGVVPIAHANDGGGSIRIPAACCGLIGLKPSRGRHIESDQAKLLPIKIISEGIVSRSVRDTAYFHAEAEKYYRNTQLPPIGLVEGPNKRRLRVGLIINPTNSNTTDKGTQDTVKRTGLLLEALGHDVEEAPNYISQSFMEDFGLYWSMLAFMVKNTGKVTMDQSFDPAQLDNLSMGLADLYKKNFHKTPLFLYRLRKTYQEYAKAFNVYDVLLTPVLAHTTPKLGYISPTIDFDELIERLTHYANFTPWANTSGGPALSIPMGNTNNNLPISVQLMAGHGQERTLLELAFEVEQAQPWRKINASS